MPFAPLLFIFIAVILLGAIFLRGYDIGTALPHPQGSGLLVEMPAVEPQVDTLTISDTAQLPDKLPELPAASKQSVVQHAQLRPTGHTPHPLPPVAEAATNAMQPVADAVHDAVEQLPLPNLVPELPEGPSLPRSLD